VSKWGVAGCVLGVAGGLDAIGDGPEPEALGRVAWSGVPVVTAAGVVVDGVAAEATDGFCAVRWAAEEGRPSATEATTAPAATSVLTPTATTQTRNLDAAPRRRPSRRIPIFPTLSRRAFS
jgi:hypothetical protein